MKKIIVVLLAFLILINPILLLTANAASQVDMIIAAGKSILGSQDYNGYCQAFVKWCYQQAGIYASKNAAYALQAWEWWGVSTSRDNIPVGSCVYFDSQSSPTYGHVGIYIGNNQFIHAVSSSSDGINGVRISNFSNYWWNYYKGWGWQAGIQPSGTDAQPPSNAWITSNYNIATSYDNVTLTWGADGASSYWMHIYKDGQDFINESVGSSTSFTRSYPEGSYTAYIEPANSYGAAPVVYVCFSVIDRPPQNIWLETNKLSYQINEAVFFTFNSDGINDVRDLYIYLPDGTQEVYCGQGTSFSKSFTIPGKYEALVQAWNAFAPECSPKIEFHIGPPTDTWIKTDKTMYKINETVNFSFGSSMSSDVRDLYIYLPDGSQEVYSGQGTSFSKSFTMPGKYEALAQSWNDIGTELTQKITFYVKDTKQSISATVTKNKTSYSVDVTSENISQSCDIIVTSYSNGKLVTIESKKSNNDLLEFTIHGNINEIKIMAWNSISSLKPICTTEAIPSSEFISH